MTNEPAAVAAYVPPGRILVAGDWHGNLDWALNVTRRVPQLLAGEQSRVILHLGDFGIWPGAEGQRYLTALGAMLRQVGAELWFIDGNHEDFRQLAEIDGGYGPGERAIVRPNIYHLPRGLRWAWHGRTWLACGGGVSLDRAARTEGLDWWPQEEITPRQEAAVIAGGHADVLVSHDCPAGVAHAFGRPPSWWSPADLARNEAHRERLRRIVDAVRPAHLMHGHLHRAYQRSCDFGYGPVKVTGLAADGVLRNFAVLDVVSMTWAPRGRAVPSLSRSR
ncbi:MAG TPA: metallophosphoesterase [Streptosporangiaceae bacterium]|nr:metallophosphoesterase [Streptosporangiaceae bacterium]